MRASRVPLLKHFRFGSVDYVGFEPLVGEQRNALGTNMIHACPPLMTAEVLLGVEVSLGVKGFFETLRRMSAQLRVTRID